jgi:MFS family permease
MYKERNEAPFIVELSRYFTTIFTMSILAIVLAGVLVARYAPETQDISALFVLKGTGLPYSAILQIAGLAFILAFFCVLITSDRFLVKMRFLLRFLLFLFATFFTTSIFAVIFKWFPADNALAWISFALSTITCFVIASGITLLNFKLQDKKYNRLLTNFKERHKDK